MAPSLTVVVLPIFLLLFLSVPHPVLPDAGEVPREHLQLYNSTTDVGVTILTSATFNDTIFSAVDELGEPSSGNLVWFVQFFNAWCGHCQHFAPYWKSVANQTLGWSSYVKMAVIDCSLRENSPACNRYQVTSFPTMQFFPPHAKIGSAVAVYLGPHTDIAVFRAMLNYLDKISFPPEIAALPPQTVTTLWKGFPSKIDVLALIVEDEDSDLGKDILLSLLPNLRVLAARRTTSLNRVLLDSLREEEVRRTPRLLFLHRDGATVHTEVMSEPENLPFAYMDAIFKKDDQLAESKNLPKPIRQALQYRQALPQPETAEKPAQKPTVAAIVDRLSNMTDLISAVVYMFSMEVSSHKTIEGDKLMALRLFVRSLSEFIPFPAQVGLSLQKLSRFLYSRAATTGEKVVGTLKEAGFDVAQEPTKWSGCAGSVPGRRGYPCSLWQLFHTLTVKAYEKHLQTAEREANALDRNSGVLRAVIGYVEYFFSCGECRDNFMQETKTLLDQTSSLSDKGGILWLWRMHNGVNRRLAGDITEDIGHPKVQFPSSEQCPRCRGSSTNRGDPGAWNDNEVVKFLKEFYNLNEGGASGRAQEELWIVRDAQHRKLVFPETGGMTSSAYALNGTSSMKVYLGGVIFVGLAFVGYRKFDQWRKRSVDWSFPNGHAREKWM